MPKGITVMSNRNHHFCYDQLHPLGYHDHHLNSQKVMTAAQEISRGLNLVPLDYQPYYLTNLYVWTIRLKAIGFRILAPNP